MQTVLFLGGIRSGKSALAQRWAESVAPQRLYVATAHISDPNIDTDFAARIALHRAQRGAGWTLCEEPLALTDCLRKAQKPVILVDCITLWLNNLMYAGRGAADIQQDINGLADWLRRAPVPVGLVTTEVGCGVVPITPLGRAFADIQGAANQTLAAVCDIVLLIHCGLPLALKGHIPKELCL